MICTPIITSIKIRERFRMRNEIQWLPACSKLLKRAVGIPLTLLMMAGSAFGEETGITEISIRDIKQIRIGQTENRQAGTGCTVFLCKSHYFR